MKKQSLQAPRRTFFSTSLYLRMPAGAALIALAVLLCYRPSMSGGFILDDDRLLAKNDLIKASDGWHRFWHSAESMEYYPLSYDTLWIEWRLWGMDPKGYHTTNVVLHIVEALLVWLILRRLSIPGAFLAALIFAVHPVNVESVAWIVQLRNVLAMLFFLLSILWYLKGIQGPTGTRPNGARRETASGLLDVSSFICHPSSFYWLSVAAFVFAMLSKGSTAVLPVVVLGIVWWLRPLTWRDLMRTAPFFLIAGVLAWVSVWYQTGGENVVIRSAGFAERLLGAGCVVWFYLFEAICPLNLCFVYPMWSIRAGSILWWLPLSAALAATAALWRYRRGWSRAILFAWGFFCVALLPVAGFADVGYMRYSLVADHYQHIAIIGAIALASAGWGAWRSRRRGPAIRVTAAVAILAVGTFAFLTWRQNGMYGDAVTLYSATLKKNPNCWMIHNNLGYILASTDQSQKAIDEAMYHFQQAVNLNPDYADAQNNLGNLLNKTGRLEDAEDHLRQALRSQPNCAESLNALGKLLLKTNRPEEAEEQFRQALALKPDEIEIHNNLGVALFRIGRYYEAMAHYQRAVRMNPDFADGYFNLALVYASLDQPAEALASARKALALARSQGQTELVKTIEDWLNSGHSGT